MAPWSYVPVRGALAMALGASLILAPAVPAVEAPAVEPIVPVASTSPPAIERWKKAERRLMRWINQERAEESLGQLKRRKTLGWAARKHSRAMREAGKIYHSDLRRTVRLLSWRMAGENVGVGPSMKSLHAAFMASEGHRDNVLHQAWSRVGVGVVRSSGGKVIWVTVLFLT